ncbi:MAG: MltR family transcriptional regulator [Bryobacteraceae bacterium]
MQKADSTRSPFSMDYTNAMRAESDRGAALVAAAYIDEALEDLILAYFVSDRKVAERLLTYPGPCSTLASRCDLAYCLGIFGKDVYADIRTIVKIRNNFAHTKEGATFERQDISDLCNNLTKAMREAGTQFIGVKPRTLFLISAGSIILALVGAKKRTAHRRVGPASKDIPRPNMNPLGC